MAKPLPNDATVDSLNAEVNHVLESWNRGGSDRAFAKEMQSSPKLEDAQRVVAESYGYESWESLTTNIQARS